MKVAFVHDPANADGTVGGAELTMREFAATAPEPLVDLETADTVVVGNCVTFGPDIIPLLDGKRVVRYHHDLARHEHPDLRGWLERNATHIFCSPLHKDRYGRDEGHLVPPAIDLARFRPNRETRRNGKRSGAVAVGTWQNPGKGQQLLKEWSDGHGPVDVYGTGPFVPHGPNLNPKGPLDPQTVPRTLLGYERFVHLPTSPEPFGRGVVEAWAAGLEVVANRLVGALWWIRERPAALETASGDFWKVAAG